MSETPRVDSGYLTLPPPRRPLPRVGDNLDRLLDLLDQARVDKWPGGDDLAAYRALLYELGRTA